MATTTILGRGGKPIELHTGLFIDNKFIPSVTGSTLEVQNPYSGEVLATLAAAEAADVDVAVKSSSAAFGTWKSTPEKGKILSRLGDLIERDAEIFGAIQALDTGTAYNEAMFVDIPQPIQNLQYFAGWSDKITGTAMDLPHGFGYTRREPLGVCAAIIPWNAPLMIAIWKLAPALATGNTLIIKMPELSPLAGQKLGELIVEAGFPAGAVNILCGFGKTAGQALAEHMTVRKISFTGSATTGREVLRASANSNLKKVSLELGGKGPSIVFSDANLQNALFWTGLGMSANNGQICALGSRIYVQDTIYAEFIEQFQAQARARPSVMGNPLENETTKGPVVSKSQHDRVLSYLKKGQEEGAKVLVGGEGAPVGSSGFVENTIFVDVREDMTIVKEEIFGPVATIHRFSTEKEVIAKANATEYGLSAAVFTDNVSRANRVAAALESGQITINSWGMLSANMPFGGVKQSGFGRDMGEASLEGWTTLKSVKQWVLDDDDMA